MEWATVRKTEYKGNTIIDTGGGFEIIGRDGRRKTGLWCIDDCISWVEANY